MESETQTPAQLVVSGRREYICKNYSKAAELLGEALEKLAKEHGDLAPELAEPNFYYGCALLELSRMESDVIGNALDGIKEQDTSKTDTDDENIIEKGPEMTEEEKEKLSDEIIDAMCEPRGEEEKPEDEKADENKVELAEEATEKEENEQTEEVEDADEDADEDDEEEAGEDEKEDVGSEEEEDELDNLQLAWEVFEVAKKIYSSIDTPEAKIKYTDCFEKLAEISREKEDFEQSLDDLKECLKLRQELKDVSESQKTRLVAETEYQMGTTCYLASWLDRAVEFYRSAHKELDELCNADKTTLEDLKTKLEAASEEEKKELEDKIKELEESTTDLTDIVNEIKNRCGEVDEDRLAEKIEKEKNGTTSNGFSPAKEDKPTDDITHLVRKKRPAPAEAEEEKKENQPTENGDSGEVDPVAKKTKVVTEAEEKEPAQIA